MHTGLSVQAHALVVLKTPIILIIFLLELINSSLELVIHRFAIQAMIMVLLGHIPGIELAIQWLKAHVVHILLLRHTLAVWRSLQ